jgi:hypothetical protein
MRGSVAAGIVMHGLKKKPTWAALSNGKFSASDQVQEPWVKAEKPELRIDVGLHGQTIIVLLILLFRPRKSGTLISDT